jgi:hypothetical protein
MYEGTKALVPLEQKQVEFYGDTVTAVLVKQRGQETIFVPLRHMCDLLGVSYQGQIRRIKEDAVLSKKLAGVNITFTPDPQTGGGGAQVVNCIPLSYLNGWLFGINAKRVKAEVRDRLILYQERCYEVLAEAFREGRLTAEPGFEDLLTNDSPAAQAYKMAAAIMQMARQQLMLEVAVESHAAQLQEHENRLETLEITLGDPSHHLTPSQAMQISQAVKAIAQELGKSSRRNEYGGVYGELYRRYEVNSYKALPRDKFEDALNWLNEWLQSLIDDNPF